MKAMRIALAISTVAALALLVAPSQAKAFHNHNECCTPETYYAHPAWGRPLTTLLAPKVHRQINYSWGSPSVRVDRTPWQFHRGGQGCAGCGASATVAPPYWPTSTTQLGTYYMRVPW